MGVQRYRKIWMSGLVCCLLTLSPAAKAQTFWELLSQSANKQSNNSSNRMSSETVYILNPDGLSYTLFNGTRSGGLLDLHVEKGEKPQDYIYFFPHNVSVTSHDSKNDIFKIPAGGYSSMDTGKLDPNEKDSRVKINTDGTYTYTSWDGTTYHNNGKNYGQWCTPNNFRYFSVAWILPENIEVIRYSSNNDSRGKWKYNPPVLSFIGSELNNFTFTVTYRVRQSELIDFETLP